ncbi:membrane protein [Clostridium bornimense]|uniref:Membrane protein n=2 Tax=Clostridium bornimense TaxID=1216932 RepID=W6RWZ8_9CLOT|nr:membrane protein [Clostridium bornimense]
MIMKIFKILFPIYLIIFPLFPAEVNRKTLFTEFFLLGILIIYVIGKFVKDSEEFVNEIRSFLKSYLVRVLLIITIFMGISVLYSPDKLLALRDTLRFLVATGLIFIVKNEYSDEFKLSNLIKLIYIPAFLEMIYGIYEKLSGKIDFFTGDIGRIQGTMGHPTILAGYATILFFPLFFVMVNEKNKKWKTFYIIELLSFVVVIFLTQSRSSWLAFGIGALVLCIYYSYKLIILFIIGGGIALLSSDVRERLLGFTNDAGRFNIWKLAVKCYKDHPIIGVGAGNYEAVHPDYVAKYPELNPGEYIYHTHNVYLKMATELGTIGLGLFITAIGFIYGKLVKVYKIAEEYKNLVVGIIISISVFVFVVSIFDNLILSPKIMNYFFIFIGVLFAIEEIKEN